LLDFAALFSGKYLKVREGITIALKQIGTFNV